MQQETSLGVEENGSSLPVSVGSKPKRKGERALSDVVNRVVHEYLAPELWESRVEASRGADGAEVTLSTAGENARLQQVGASMK